MYANATAETCTGTGATLALAGAVSSNHIQFSKSYADGALVAYFVEDSGGTIKVAGIGTYVSATDDITRNDTWNWNGTVIDDNPATNITLSGGTHTVRCDLIDQDIVPSAYYFENSDDLYLKNIFANADGTDGSTTLTSTKIFHTPFYIPRRMSIDGIQFQLTTAQASSFARVGLSSINPLTGEVLALIVESANVDTSTTGAKIVSITSQTFSVDTMVFAWISSDDSGLVISGRTRGARISTPSFNTVNGGDKRSYPNLVMPVSSGQPAYPTPVAFNAFDYSDVPELVLRRP